MTNIKKITSLIITLSLVLTLGLNVFALGGGTVSNLTASISGKSVNVSGDTSNVAAAVAVQVLDAEDHIIGMSSFTVNDNHFSGSVSVSGSIDLNAVLTVRAADSDGGNWATTTVNAPLAVFGGYQMRLDGYIGVDYYVKLDPSLQNANTKITFTVNSAFENIATQEVGFSSAIPVAESNLFGFPIKTVVTETALPVTVTLTNGDTTITFDSFTTREYLNHYAASDNAALADLAKSIRNYGFYAQVKFGPADPIYAEDGLTLVDPDYDMPSIGDMPSGVNYAGSSVVFLSGNKIKHYFTFDDDPAAYTFKINGHDVEKVDAGNNEYSISSEELYASALNSGVTVQIFKNGSEVKIFNYSPMNYAKAVVESANTSSQMKNLARAFAMYYTAANNYNNPGNH